LLGGNTVVELLQNAVGNRHVAGEVSAGKG
jgi:hypothetical protein